MITRYVGIRLRLAGLTPPPPIINKEAGYVPVSLTISEAVNRVR
jgi:hypothetical protein